MLICKWQVEHLASSPHLLQRKHYLGQARMVQLKLKVGGSQGKDDSHTVQLSNVTNKDKIRNTFPVPV